jgi:hypothetical protein
MVITQAEYDQLKKDSDLLNCLLNVGVDNWGGWEEAQKMLNGEND